MARYEVFAAPDGRGWWLDVQADLLGDLSTRVVVPLLPEDHAPPPARRLNPVFEVEGVRVVMLTQFLAAVPRAAMGKPSGTLAGRSEEISAALDMVFVGF
jgi:toxin CcdB